MEEAVAAGTIRDIDGVEAWANGVLWTSGVTAAGLAARGCRLARLPEPERSRRDWDDLDAEADARTPSPAQRATARRLGRQLVRTARRVWASELLEMLAVQWPAGLHRPVAFGAAVAVAGGSPPDAALGEAYCSVAVPVGAAVRLLGLDPVSGTGVLARLGAAMQQVADQAAQAASGPSAALPARSAPMVDLYAEIHTTREATLFAS
jgi:urease accessory protein